MCADLLLNMYLCLFTNVDIKLLNLNKSKIQKCLLSSGHLLNIKQGRNYQAVVCSKQYSVSYSGR